MQCIVAKSITPYQKFEDYDRCKNNKDLTFLWAMEKPAAWETCAQRFEGEGGLAYPDGVKAKTLACSSAQYEMPLAVMQYRVTLLPGERKEWRFVFGPAKDTAEIMRYTETYRGGFAAAKAEYAAYFARFQPAIQIKTPDAGLNNFVNHWLARQMYFHGATQRFCTDPQTRNYLQDAMGMTYVTGKENRKAFLFALSQQKASGAMPDGILLHKDAQLKYINQVPHSDHCVWLPVTLRAYLAENADYALLSELVGFADSPDAAPVYSHIDRAVDWLLADRDERGLNFIRQGDWCDPMNAVGRRGIGVSSWLTMGTALAADNWAAVCEETGRNDAAKAYRQAAEDVRVQVNRYFWTGSWYARGMTDDGVRFGVPDDAQGRIYLNAQSWAMLCGAAQGARIEQLIEAVERELVSLYGVEMLAPAYTHPYKCP